MGRISADVDGQDEDIPSRGGGIEEQQWGKGKIRDTQRLFSSC